MQTKNIFEDTINLISAHTGFNAYLFAIPSFKLVHLFSSTADNNAYQDLIDFLSNFMTKDLLTSKNKRISTVLLTYFYEDVIDLIEMTKILANALDQNMSPDAQREKSKLKLYLIKLLNETLELHKEIINFYIDQHNNTQNPAKVQKQRILLKNKINKPLLNFKKILANSITKHINPELKSLKDSEKIIKEFRKKYPPKQDLTRAKPESKAIAKLKRVVKLIVENELTQVTSKSRNVDLVNLKPYYWLEKLDPKHRNIDFLKVKHKEWESKNNVNENFFTWLEKKSDASSPAEKPLEYCAQEKQRSHYKIQFDEGSGKVLGRNFNNFNPREQAEPSPIDTAKFSGKKPGYAAYVLSSTGVFYLAPHVHHLRAHASFMGGNRIICAGMIKIKEGKILDINNESGHYKPLVENLRNAVSLIPKSCFHKNHHITFSTPVAPGIGKTFSKMTSWFFKRLGDLLLNPFISHKFKYDEFLNKYPVTPPKQNLPAGPIDTGKHEVDRGIRSNIF